MKFPVLATTLSLLVAGAAHAVPDVVSYAARVENDAGLFSGTVSATFQLFAASTGGTELWSENAASIVVIGGDLVHDLGSIEPLDDTVLAGGNLFLQVIINGDVLEPRAAIRAVPFALLAKNAEVAARAVFADSADRLGGQSPSSFQFTAGANGGLALAGTAFSIAQNGVTADHIAAAAVSLEKMAANSVDGSKIVDGGVSLAKMAADSVDGSKIVDGAVSLAKMAANSVDGSKIVNGALSLAKMAANSVDGSKIIDGAVSLAKMAANSVDSSKIVNGAVSLAKLAANSVDGSKIVDGSVGGNDLGAGSVTSAKIATGAVGTAQILDLSVINSDLANNSISSTKIAANAVTADKINGTLIPLFSRPTGCGGGLQVGNALCASLVCGEFVRRDSFNVILDVDVLFFSCAGGCPIDNGTISNACPVTAAGNMLPTAF